MRRIRILAGSAALGVLSCGVAQLLAQDLQVRARDALPLAQVDPNAEKKLLSVAEEDKKALEAAGLKKDDPAGLLKYLNQRALNDTDLKKIEDLIKQLGSAEFEEREKAAEQIELIGTNAIGPLKLVPKETGRSPEIIYRSKEVLRRIEKVPQASVTSAAIRALTGVKNKEIVPVLLRFLPLADSEEVIEQIQATLLINGEVDGKADPALIAALTDTNIKRRLVASMVLCESPKFGKDYREKELTPKILSFLKEEKEPTIRFSIIKSFMLGGTHKPSVAMMIDLIPDLKRHQIWQVEDLLLQLAGADAPKVKCLKTKESLVKAQTAWKEWWTKAEKDIKFEPGVLKPRILGKFYTLSVDYRFGQNGMLTEYGLDDKEVWKLSGLGMPMDAAFTTKGTLLTVDQNQNTISERDLSGKVLTSKRVELTDGKVRTTAQPIAVQQLDDGGMFVTCRTGVIQYDKDGKEKLKYQRPANVNFGNADVTAARILSDGRVIVSVMNNGANGQNPQMIFLDKEGKEIKGKEIKTGQPNNYMGTILELSADKILLTEINQIVEYDLKTGKAGTKQNINQPRGIQRLPNGNILFADFNQYPPRIVERTPENEEAWSFTMKDANENLMKAFVR